METEVLVAIIGGTVTVTTAIVAGIFKLLENKRKKVEEANKREPMTQIKLFEKDLFSKSDYWVSYAIKRLGFEQGDRNWIYETIMKCEIEVVVKNTKKFLETYDLAELPDAKFENLIFITLSETIEEYNALIKENFKEYFGKNKGEKIFNLVMDKQPTKESQSAGFNVWNATTITHLEKSIKGHCDAYYPNNIERADRVLDEIKCAISSVHVHLYKTFGNFNGELDYLLCL